MFAKRWRIDAIHVPFRGAAQTIPAMLAGDVNFAIDNLASYVPVIQSGKMRALAVTSAQRWPTLPDIPTMGEAGIKDFVITSWAAFVLPATTPRPIIDALSAAQRKIASDSGFGTLPYCRRACPFQHAGRRDRLRRQGAHNVEGCRCGFGRESGLSRRPVRYVGRCTTSPGSGPVAQQDRAAVS